MKALFLFPMALLGLPVACVVELTPTTAPADTTAVGIDAIVEGLGMVAVSSDAGPVANARVAVRDTMGQRRTALVTGSDGVARGIGPNDMVVVSAPGLSPSARIGPGPVHLQQMGRGER